MSNERKESRNEQDERTARETLHVTVSAQPGAPEPIRPETITLNKGTLRVVWRCNDLPAGAGLQIVFRGDPSGPFSRLQSKRNEVIGWVNRESEQTPGEYVYEARIVSSTGNRFLGTGIVLVPITDYPPPPPPPPPEYPQ